MSIDLNWETVTGGPDGLELAHQIRDFIHARFQTIPLPRFIKSVTVHDFEFGSIPPELELKDITDPLPDFYAENPDIDDADSNESDSGDDDGRTGSSSNNGGSESDRRREGAETGLMNRGDRPGLHPRPHLNLDSSKDRESRSKILAKQLNDAGSPFLRVSTPGIPGGTSNLSYFHSHFGTALSGSQTPLAAMAGAHHLGNSWLEAHHGHSTSAPNLRQQYARSLETGGGAADGFQLGHSRNRNMSQSSSIMDFNQPPNIAGAGLAPGIHSPSSPASPSGLGISGSSVPHPLREKHSVSTLAPTSVGTSRPPTRDAVAALGDHEDPSAPSNNSNGTSPNDSEESQRRFREPRVEDIQAVFRIKYAGDIKLLLTADILLDYPMPSFVGIPVRLSITGLTFDGVGVLAHIRKRVHFCFLSPEDAVAAVGGEENLDRGDEGGPRSSSSGSAKIGGLLQEIRVESEIGQRESGKQSLKNVGKVERFVLEQVRRIFEEELVYPSFWTFLV
ncbi:hypothetical protein V8F20_008354 [Naviculisporaceae sp. PSN 640]